VDVSCSLAGLPNTTVDQTDLAFEHPEVEEMACSVALEAMQCVRIVAGHGRPHVEKLSPSNSIFLIVGLLLSRVMVRCYVSSHYVT
jgi:hypothetical protein